MGTVVLCGDVFFTGIELTDATLNKTRYQNKLERKGMLFRFVNQQKTFRKRFQARMEQENLKKARRRSSAEQIM